MSEWKEVRFQEVIKLNPRVKLEKGKVYPFIGIQDIDESTYYVQENEMKEFTGQSGSKFESGDTLFSRITPCLENRKIAQANLNVDLKGFGSTELLVFRAIQGLMIPSYVNYLAQTDFIVLPAINSMSGASGRQRADSNFIKKIKFRVPNIETQTKIVSILSTYDRLIENNNRRIQILEQTAEELYKEWFVRMRFPGYEKTKFDKGIPEGWEIKKVEEIISFDIGGGWGEESLMNDFTEQAYVIRGTDIPNMKYGEFNYELLRYHKKSNLKSRKLESTDIIFEASGGSKDQRLGRTFYVTEEILSMFDNDVICASFCKLIKIEDKYLSWFFYNYLRYAYQTEILSTFEVQSTGISNFGFSKFKKYHQLLVPTSNVMEQFYNLTYPILVEMQKLGNKNQNLVKQRDLLLPRLMNGTITVK